MVENAQTRQGGRGNKENLRPVAPIVLNIDLNELRKIVLQGVRRAAAFLSIGLQVTENYIPNSLALSRHSNIRFFPEPLLESAGQEAVKEFRTWLVGNALRELDLHFSLFLDRTCATLRYSKLHGTRVRSNHVVAGISGDTNAASKLKTVMRELGQPEPDVSRLWSLSNARNCLSHTAGVVTPRHAKSDGTLLIRWIGGEPRLVQGEHHTIIPPVIDELLQAPDPSKEADLVLVFVDREKRFAVGGKIELTPHELHEICLYYKGLAEKVLARLTADLQARGIGAAETAPVTGVVGQLEQIDALQRE